MISSVRPEPTSAGQIILYRHLVGQPGIDLEVYGEEPNKLTPTSAVRRLVGRLGQTPLRKWAEDFWVFWQARWIDPMLPRVVENPRQTVVVTMAHGDGFMAALRFARKRHLPLVSFFQDWWPDMANVHGFARPGLANQFRKLADASSVAICVSEGMKNALGNKQCVVLPPISAAASRNAASPKKVGKFRLAYCGNVTEYGPMLANALRVLASVDGIELLVRGGRPNWPQDFADEMKKTGRLLEFAPRQEFDAWLQAADAFLVPMVFDPVMRRRMETSFPSKLIEFAQFGKPLVVWGPAYCSAVRWAKQSNAALCVTERDPEHLANALQRLARSAEDCTRLATASQAAAHREFDPKIIQEKFLSILQKVLKKNEWKSKPRRK